MQTDAKGWTKAWYGYYREDATTKSEVSAISLLERGCFTNAIMRASDKEMQSIDLLELGCGYGEWCMALAGVVNNRIMLTGIIDYRAFGIDGEAKYLEIAQKHIDFNAIPNITLINAAVADKTGECLFNQFTGDKSYYCQGMTGGNFGGSRAKTAVLAAYHTLKGKTISVPMTTVDEMVKIHSLRNVIVHCDVQGVEDRVVAGAMQSLEYIDSWIFGTHNAKLNKKLRNILEPYYDCLVDEIPNKEKQNGLCQDGLQYYAKK